MSGLSGRDWALNVHYPVNFYISGVIAGGFPVVTGNPVYVLGITLTRAEACELQQDPRRGYGVSFTSGLSTLVRAENIELTREEASRIANGEHPRDVVLFPACGYRLTVVPEMLKEVT